MLMIDGDRQIVGDLAGEIACLESLLADLERFGNGELPTDQELDAAPLLHPFTVAARPSVCLVGGNLGHPVRQGPTIRTSEVWLLAPELRWARTFIRLYRLGEPALLGGCGGMLRSHLQPEAHSGRRRRPSLGDGP